MHLQPLLDHGGYPAQAQSFHVNHHTVQAHLSQEHGPSCPTWVKRVMSNHVAT